MDEWKANNLGLGSYTISSSSSLSIKNDSSAVINHDSKLNLDDTAEIDLDNSSFTIRGRGEIRMSNYGDSLTVSRGYGIGLLFNQRINGSEINATITNNCGYKIRIIAISVTSKTGTSLRVQNKTVNSIVGENTVSIALTNNVPTLIMWSERSA